jgi:hypothetical protein
MSSLLDGLMEQLGPSVLAQMGQHLGTDSAATAGAVSSAIPVLISALAKNASNPQGANALNAALSKDHDGSVLGDLMGAVTGYQNGPGAGILKHVLGDRQDAAAATIGKTSGIDPAKAGALLTMLAPIVLGSLGKARQSRGLDAGGVAAMLGQERQHLEKGNGGLGGLLSFLDADKDGSIVDDVLGMAGKFLRK